QRQVVDVVAGGPLAGRQAAGRQRPQLLAVVEIQGADVPLADNDGARAEDAGQVEVVLLTGRVPEQPAVAEVQAVDGGGVVGREDHPAVLNDGGGRPPTILVGRPRHATHGDAAAAPGAQHQQLLHLVVERL